MGADMDKSRTTVVGPSRSKPPPIPPRPQHLIPAKTMAKYSSMPDVLNGWQRDPNPDLLKLSHSRNYADVMGVRKGAVSTKISALDVAISCNSFRQNGVVHTTNGSVQQLYDAKVMGACRAVKSDNQLSAGVADSGNASHKVSPVKKLSCIPSRSNSKKRAKNVDCTTNKSTPATATGTSGGCDSGNNNYTTPNVGAKNDSEISQTSWYVQDVAGNSVVQLSKCEIAVNSSSNRNSDHCYYNNPTNNCRYSATINRSKSSSTSPSATLASTAGSNSSGAPSRSKFSFFRKFRPGGGNSSTSKSSLNENHKKSGIASASSISGPQPSAPFFACLNGPPPAAPSSSSFVGPSPISSFSSTITGLQPVASSSSSVTRPPPFLSSSPALSRLPPLPKCFTEASPLWDPPENKKISSHSVNLSPSSSCASSSSRSTSRSTSSGGYPKVPLQSSSSSRSGSVGFDGATSSKSKSPALKGTGDVPQRSDRRPMPPPPPPPPPPRKPTSLDIKLATLRREMQDLRQMDLTLLSQLWSLNEAITEFRHMQVCLSPDCPSVHSSDDEEDDSGCYYSNLSSQGIVTNNQQSNTLGSSSSRSSASTNRSKDATKPR